MTLAERSEVVAIVWPGTANITDLLNRCALVNDVELGLEVLALSPAEQERIREEIGKRRKAEA